MLGISALLGLIGLVVVVMSVILMMTRKNKNLAFASFFMGLALIFVPSTLIYLLLN